MIFRALITSGIVSVISLLIYSFITREALINHSPLSQLTLLWIIGFFSVLGFIYGKRIQRSLQHETGSIKWFDPSKGYGFLVRDKGGDLFVHLRSIKPEDRRKIRENVRVKFSVENSDKGPQAVKIRII
tara:strand:- start:100 stop:486 length:387 start_codon:yes stop_codon:yes gene_type:complete